MLSKIIFIPFFLVVYLSCKNNDSQKTQVPSQSTNQDSIRSTKDTVPKIEIKIPDSLQLNSHVLVTSKSKIEIASSNKYIDSTLAYANSFQRDKLKCNNWSLNKENIKTILLTSEAINSSELHYDYDVYTCYYMGEITVDGKRAVYKINAGAFSIIDFKDTSLFIGYKQKDYRKYFLSGPGIK